MDNISKSRLWPGIGLVILQWLLRFVLPAIFPGTIIVGVFGSIIIGFLVLVWWVFFSGVKLFDRWLAVVLIIISLILSSKLIDISMATAMMGMMFWVFSIPVMCLALVLWAIATAKMTEAVRRISMVAVILVAAGVWICLRTKGMDGEIHQYFAWRWAKTSEERLLSNADKVVQMISDTTASGMDWPGFRGPGRDGVVKGASINTDWKKSPPVQLWRHAVGPGCSSFSIHNNLLFTQEQRGDFETVSCYNLRTGEPVWFHKDSARFWDSHAGAGPRSTPTLEEGRVYTLGATGIFNVLNETDGKVIWTHDAAKDTKVKIPGWGYTSSPLVVDSLVVVAISGEILAYDIENGSLKWSGEDGGESYSSPHLINVEGTKQILFMNKTKITGFVPSDGKILWQLPLAGVPIDQPSQISENDLVFGETEDTGGKGMRRVSIHNTTGKWTALDGWSSDQLKPYFNDFVIHKGCAFGFDGPYLVCLDISNGKRIWRGGRYTGELLLLPDQDLIVILSEKGELALVSASPAKFIELGKIQALKGKTWNHPAMAGNIVLVRNSEEMAAYRL
jgi:outer membrane protein assembly factor BamB